MFSFKRKKVKTLPVEVLEYIFCQLEDTNSLLHCRRVCKIWNETIDRLAVRRKIIIPYFLHYDKIKHVDQQLQKKLKKSVDKNLLKNPYFRPERTGFSILRPSNNFQLVDSREQKCVIPHWSDAGYFRLETPSSGTTSDIPKHILYRCGLTSMSDLTVVASWGQGCIQSQSIYLAHNRISDEMMDQIQPTIVCEIWIGNRFDFESCVVLFLTLLNRPFHNIAKKFVRIDTPFCGSGVWRKVVISIKNYGPGVRLIKFSRSGRETADQYREGSEEFSGPKFALNRIFIRLPKY
ncbi:F-box only protein 44-like isoform X2 [Cloeon dipterum]|uniref:F-box only protein 44-like isoform X2 n=1 Tax=Cloeon dipterum TaxID=197152 RepID=UPI00322040CC